VVLAAAYQTAAAVGISTRSHREPPYSASMPSAIRMSAQPQDLLDGVFIMVSFPSVCTLFGFEDLRV
jgi:hypothetical protein